MGRIALMLLTILSISGVSVSASVEASTSDMVREALKARYRISRMEVQNEQVQGRVLSPATVLLLRADGISGKQFRTIQANTKSPRFHVRDYARIEIAPDGRFTAASGDFTLPKGSQLVVLDLKITSDEVRLFTHTLDPVRRADRRDGYGCAEFVFRFPPGLLDRGEMAAVQSRIGEFLTLASVK